MPCKFRQLSRAKFAEFTKQSKHHINFQKTSKNANGANYEQNLTLNFYLFTR
ncbi:hypothetical protein [Campylobacter concisus]|uniref:hypothetical protein n=1 Tax=Campylobacter concisus TaxID=199 RepID=UPI00131C7C27|nr:hypothetical protein [Campylobacter concisus]